MAPKKTNTPAKGRAKSSKPRSSNRSRTPLADKKNNLGSADAEKAQPPEPHQVFLTLSDSYLIDLECLREMFTSVLPVLQKKDADRQARVNAILKRADVKIPKGANKHTLTINSEDVQELLAALRKLRRGDVLFRHHSVVALVSRFDEFFSGLLKSVLETHPEWLKSSERTLTYKELIELKSINVAINGIIAKEIDRLMRGSHAEQIEFLDEKLKLGIKSSFARLPEFLEITERRNLFVHTGGKVSEQYVENCKKFGVEIAENIQLTQRLDVDPAYFDKAFAVSFEAGLRIAQATYRRLFPTALANADQALNQLAIRFLESADWALAETIADFDVNIPKNLRSEGELYYFAVVNRGVARKVAGKPHKEGLQGIAWDAFHPKYKLCLAVLDDDFEAAAKMMKNDAIKHDIGKTGLRSWPVFRNFRRSPEFASGYKALFNEAYVADPERDAADLHVISGQSSRDLTPGSM